MSYEINLSINIRFNFYDIFLLLYSLINLLNKFNKSIDYSKNI